jgi:hypothetical protein
MGKKTREEVKENPERMQEEEVNHDDSEELLLSFQVRVIEKNNLRGPQRKTYHAMMMISAGFAAGVVTVLNIALLFCLCAMLLRTSLRAPLVL